MLRLILPVFTLYLASTVTAYSKYSIPVPTFEAFAPKGLRVSIPDEHGIDYFEFHATFQRSLRSDNGEISSSKVTADQGHWIFWNPDIVIKPGDTINYWVTVRKDGVNYRRENELYVFEKVTYLPDSEPPPIPDCEESSNYEQRHISENFNQDFDKLKEMTLGRGSETFGTGEQRKSYESSYSSSSSHQSSSSSSSGGSQPVVRSSSSKMQGSYIVKPTGIEGTGVQETSNYDSTKPNGLQWQHTRKELTAEELARHPHLKDFSSLTTINKGEHGHIPTTGYNQEYHQSYYKKETNSNSNSNVDQRPAQFQHSYFQTQTVPQSRPQYYQTNYYKEETVQRNQQNPHVQVRVPVYPLTIESKREEKVTEVNRGDTLQGLVRDRAPVPVVPLTVETTREEKYREVNKSEKPRPVSHLYQETYSGAIFETTSAKVPTECRRLEIDSKFRSLNYDTIGRELTELRCLSNILESTFRSEIRALKQQNEDLVRRLSNVEQEAQHLKDTCECVERD